MLGFHRRAELTAAERTRRAVAATVAETSKPRLPNGFAVERPGEHGALVADVLREAARNGELHQDELASSVFGAEPGGHPPGAVAAEAAAHATAQVEADQAPAPNTDEAKSPVVTITISGLPHAGKSVVAHVIRAALAREGIVATGPEGLHSIVWHKAVAHLIWRGLTVELQEAEAGSPESDAIAWRMMSPDWRIALADRLGESLTAAGLTL